MIDIQTVHMQLKVSVLTSFASGHHGSSEKEQLQESEAVEELDRLINYHDVIFALTDSREARFEYSI